MNTKSLNPGNWLLENQIVSTQDLLILESIIKERKNILIAGNRSSGKSTLLRILLNYVENDERLLLFDLYNDVRLSLRSGKTIVVGYGENADIKGEPTRREVRDMAKKAVLLPFERVVCDEIFGKEIEPILESLHGSRCGIFTYNYDTALNAFKAMYLNTIFPEGKNLKPEHAHDIANTFSYAITLGEKIIIEKVLLQNNELFFEKINK